jgi:SNF2 family DNA or RNA helicase
MQTKRTWLELVLGEDNYDQEQHVTKRLAYCHGSQEVLVTRHRSGYGVPPGVYDDNIRNASSPTASFGEAATEASAIEEVWDESEEVEGISYTAQSLSINSPLGWPAQNGLATLPEDTRVCFGMLCGVKARFQGNGPSDQTTSQSLLIPETIDNQHTYGFEVVEWFEYFALQGSTTTVVAIIDEETSDGLRCLASIPSIRFESYLTHDDWENKLEMSSSRKSKFETEIEVTVYGNRAVADELCKALDDAELFLQRPVITRGCPYENPQNMQFSDLEEDDDATSISEADAQAISQEAMASQFTLENDLALILDNLPSHDFLREATISVDIKSPLMKHQKEGVDFILRSEAGETAETESLWERIDSENNDPIYRHIITGTRRAKLVSGPYGGIIADDMGLGKSLTMLAAIYQSRVSAGRFSGETNQAVTLQARTPSKATLIVVPSVSLIDNWLSEVQTHFDVSSLSYFKYHGPNRRLELSTNINCDLILTTYGTIAADFRASSGGLDESHFLRIVLDEAHFIRSRASKQCQAVRKLSSKYRWCLSGTPIQNKVDDLGALISFLKVPILEDSLAFRNYFTNVDKQTQATNLRRILGSICLRRSNKILSQPKPKLQELMVLFTAAEKQAYLDIIQRQKTLYQMAISGYGSIEPQFTTGQTLMRLRLYCNHGSFDQSAVGGTQNEMSPDEYFAVMQQTDKAQCIHCNNPVLSVGLSAEFSSGVVASCGHLICSICYECSYVTEKRRRLRCLNCVNGESTSSKYTTPERMDIDIAPGDQKTELWCEGHSSKMTMLLTNLIQHINTDKAIVFSSWKKSLDVVDVLLQRNRIPFVRVDGTMSSQERGNSLRMFNEYPHTRVLLMTLGTGSTGFNLQAATRIHILEPQWNPGVEKQAIGRAIRIGQDKDVTVIRYIVKDTVEENIRHCQQHKLSLAEQGFYIERLST